MTPFAVVAAAAVVAFVLTALAVPRGPETLRRSNFRSRPVSLAGGLAGLAVLLAAVAVAAVLTDGPARTAARAALVAAAAAGAAGVYDDVRGSPAARGLAGHLRALLRGRVTSGLVKLAVVGLGGVAAALVLYGASARGAAAAVVVAGTANLVNLFDLRPGRALKVVLLATLPLLAAGTAAPVAAAAAGTAAGLLPYDLGERTMLGDGGANALGAVAGVALAAAAPTAGWAYAVAAVVVAATLASEVVSFSRVIDAVPPLRWADRLGRAA